jgi:hypothetical protein
LFGLGEGAQGVLFQERLAPFFFFFLLEFSFASTEARSQARYVPPSSNRVDKISSPHHIINNECWGQVHSEQAANQVRLSLNRKQRGGKLV